MKAKTMRPPTAKMTNSPGNLKRKIMAMKSRAMIPQKDNVNLAINSSTFKISLTIEAFYHG
ncbi:MAG: hypothetical protein HZA15_15420 [Nitrospirae bacterium]|nr:hypothetical protein [Nitrospirota bacterium]